MPIDRTTIVTALAFRPLRDEYKPLEGEIVRTLEQEFANSQALDVSDLVNSDTFKKFTAPDPQPEKEEAPPAAAPPAVAPPDFSRMSAFEREDYLARQKPQ